MPYRPKNLDSFDILQGSFLWVDKKASISGAFG
jgi:hypothetical protein